MIQLGHKQVGRLILGSNPMLGYSAQQRSVEPVDGGLLYRRKDCRTFGALLMLGINTWQTSASEKVDKALEMLRSRGHDIQWIFLANAPHLEDTGALNEIIRRNKPAAVVHHGQVSDRLLASGTDREGARFRQARFETFGILRRFVIAQSRGDSARGKTGMEPGFLHDIVPSSFQVL